MKINTVKQKITSGGTSIGTFIFEFNTTGIARLAAQAGAEFAIFDMEHTGWNAETIRMLVATSRSTALVPLVRIPATEYHFIASVLDMGAMGIMIPMCDTAEQARKFVSSAKYPPVGRRGTAFTIAHDDYISGNIVEKMSSANSETLLIAQIETMAGLENVDAIAGVEGIDVLWIGLDQHRELVLVYSLATHHEDPNPDDKVERNARQIQVNDAPANSSMRMIQFA